MWPSPPARPSAGVRHGQVLESALTQFLLARRETSSGVSPESMQEFGKFPKKSERPRFMGLYEFGPFCLNPLKRIVLRDGDPLALTPKCFDILLALVEHAGEILVKEELMKNVWPDTVVEEGNLNRNISTLRRVLGESPNDHRYVVTVPGRGYRFVAEVREVPEDHPTVSRHAPQGAGMTESLEFPYEPFARKATVQPLPVPSPSIVRSQPPQRFYGLRRRIIWVAVGVAACFLAVVIVFRPGFRTKPVLSATDQVLIADFSNTTGDTVFDDTLKQAISVQLTQSPYLNILSDARVSSILKLMTKPPGTKISADVARDLCQRAGAKAYIAGSITTLGAQYVIGLSAIECRSGDSIALEQGVAQSKEQVLNALDAVTTKLRAKLGESLSTMDRFDTSLVQATTPSLEALQAFSQGDIARDRKGDAAAVPFFKRAIELDPNFALAYDALGITYSNLDEPGLAGENITKAYALRERASQREKFEITANYSQIATGELEKANQIAELWAQAYPRDVYPHNILGVNYEFLGQYEKAVAEMSEAARLNPDGVVLLSNLMEDYTALGRLDQAKAMYELALARKLDHPYLHADRYGLAFLESDDAEMSRQVAWATGRTGAEDFLISSESDTSAFFGHLGRSREFSRLAIASSQRAGQKETAALWQMNAALREAEFGNSARAKQEIAAALAIAASRDVQVLAALALARTGEANRAQKMSDDVAKQFPLNTVLSGYWLPTIRAAIALDRDKPSEAIEALQPCLPFELGYPNPEVEIGRYLYPVYVRGQAYLLMHRGGEGLAEFQKFVDRRSVVVNSPLGALARLGLARAYNLSGENAKSRAAYEDFFRLWRDADPDIPILAQARAEYSKLSN